MKLKLLTLFIFFIGCAKAPGPTLVMERAKLMGVKKIAILPVTNVTPVKEITPLVEQTFRNELSELKKYKYSETKEEVRPQNADAIIGCTITEYIPFESKLEKTGKDVSYDISTFEESKREAKEGHGCLWGFLVDLFIPSHRIKGGEEYKYKTITRSPSIGMELILTDSDGSIIYKGSKFISEGHRIPDCYTATYGTVLPEEQLNSIDFLASLALKELIEPLK